MPGGVVILLVQTRGSTGMPSERRFDLGLTLCALKCRLETITGIPASSQKLRFLNGSCVHAEHASSNDDSLQLCALGLADFMTLEVDGVAATGVPGFGDSGVDPSIPKFELPDSDYDKLADSVRAFKRRNKLGRFGNDGTESSANDSHGDPIQLAVAECERKGIVAGARVSVDGVTGTVRYVGAVEFETKSSTKPKAQEKESNVWLGIEYDEPRGKNNGTVNGCFYFNAQPGHGVFVRPHRAVVGDFPVQDVLADLEEL